MPKKDQKRERPPAEEPSKKAAGYGLAKGSGIGKTDGKASRDDRRKREREVEADTLDNALEDADEMRTDSEDEEEPAPTPGTPGDGKFRISFIQMGKGDCTIMCTPQGKIILIDCGSSDGEQPKPVFTARVKGELQSAAYLRNTMTIDVVIITHPDNDHWGQFSTLLKGFTLEVVYHSGAIGTYGGAATWAREQVRVEGDVKQVVLNQDDDEDESENSLNGEPIPLADDADAPEWLEDDGGLVVVSEPNCTITLLAAGVKKEYEVDGDRTDLTNRGSIVTLVNAFGKKFLISGDATKSTEAFIMDNTDRGARLAGVHYVQVGHHGSHKSSMQTWVDQLRPVERAIVSAPKAGKATYALPRAEVIRRYLQRFVTNGRAADAIAHQVSAWDTAVDAQKPAEWGVKQPVYTMGTSGTQHISVP